MKPLNPDWLLFEVRRQLAMSQEDLDRELIVSYDTVNYWKNGYPSLQIWPGSSWMLFVNGCRRLAGLTRRSCDAVFQCDFSRQGLRMSGRIVP